MASDGSRRSPGLVYLTHHLAAKAPMTPPDKTIRCAHPGELALTAGESRWAVSSLRYWQSIAYPGVDPSEVAADYAEAWRRMTAVCGLTATQASSAESANVVASSAPIDGPYNVLALSQLPPADAPATMQLTQTFDEAETELSRDQRIAMMAHEIGHCLGLGHSPEGSGNLMAPILGAVGSPQAGDVAELQDRYGPPATTPGSPASATTPTAAPAAPPVLVGTLEFVAPGTYALAIAGETVAEFTIPAPGDYPLTIGPK